MFAILEPGAHLNPHRDPFGGSLRYHLGLVTPNSDDCFIVVDGERYSWRDGEAVMFDETFIHWADNKTPTTRIILFCDVERPLTSRLMTRVNRYVIENFVKISATQNVEGEPVGALNRFYGKVIHPIGSRINDFFRTLKQRNKPLSVVFKYTLALGLIYLIFSSSARARARPAVRHRPHRGGGALLHDPRRDRQAPGGPLSDPAPGLGPLHGAAAGDPGVAAAEDGRRACFARRGSGLQLVRGAILPLSSLCFFSALKYLPLAEATAINYGTPILVIILAVVFLGERMTRPRIALVLAGIAGMFLIVRPGSVVFQGAALLALGLRRVLRRRSRSSRACSPARTRACCCSTPRSSARC